MGLSNQKVIVRSYRELWENLEVVDKKKIIKRIFLLSVILSVALTIINLISLISSFAFRANLTVFSQILSIFNSLLLVFLVIGIIIFIFTISSENNISILLFIFYSMPLFLFNLITNSTLKIVLGEPGSYSGFFYNKDYLRFLENVFWEYEIFLAFLLISHFFRWLFESGVLGSTEQMSIEEASQLIKGMIKTRKLVDIQELSRLTGKSINIWTAKIYQLTGAGIIDGEFDGLNFVPRTKDLEYLADQIAGKTVTVEGIGNFKPCCYNAARVGDTYCMCGLVIPEELRKHVGS